MRVMRTLYVTGHTARVRVSKGNIVVERTSDATRVPIETLEAVVLTGRAELTNDAMGELARRGVRVSALSKTGKLRFTVAGPMGGNVQLRLAQYKVASDQAMSVEVARLVVAGKLQNCRRMMTRWLRDSGSPTDRWLIRRAVEGVEDRVAALGAARDGDMLRGIEGDGTRRYFKALATHLGTDGNQLTFHRRSRRPPRDPVNALMSFTYGLLLTEVIGALESVGLDPQVGFLHCPRPGRPSLALDLLEEFRPALADRFSVAVLRRGQVTAHDFEARAGHAVYLTDDGRRKVLRLYEIHRQQSVPHPLLDRKLPVAMLPTVQATLLARHLRGDLPVYPPFTVVA